MIRRPRRSTPATIVAVLLLVACVLTAVSVVQSLLGRTPLISLSDLLGVVSSQTWNGPGTVTVAVVVAVLGLVLLLAAVRPGRPTVMPLLAMSGPDGSAGAAAGVRRASLDKDLSSVVSGVPGVVSAGVSAGRRTVTARITVAAVDPTVVPGQVRERLEARLVEIGPAVRPRVRVQARREKNS